MVTVEVAFRMDDHWYNGKRISLNLLVWGSLLSKTKIPFQCDNMSVVAAIKRGTAKDDTVMHLLRCLWFCSLL